MKIGGYAASSAPAARTSAGSSRPSTRRSSTSPPATVGGVMARYNHDDNWLLGTTAGQTLHLSIDKTGLDYEVDLPSFGPTSSSSCSAATCSGPRSRSTPSRTTGPGRQRLPTADPGVRAARRRRTREHPGVHRHQHGPALPRGEARPRGVRGRRARSARIPRGHPRPPGPRHRPGAHRQGCRGHPTDPAPTAQDPSTPPARLGCCGSCSRRHSRARRQVSATVTTHPPDPARPLGVSSSGDMP